MEFSSKQVLIERFLAGLAFLSLAVLIFFENRSPLDTALREGQSWAVLNHSFLSVYHPHSPHFIILPFDSKDREEVAKLFEELSPAQARTPSGFFDQFLWKWELSRSLNPDRDQAQLPQNAKERRYLISKLLYPSQDSILPSVTAEVLNASQTGGLALAAAKVLRSNGVDVVGIGNAKGPASHSVIYDRTGNPSAAEQAFRALGCSKARVSTQLDEKRLLDASIVLASDCSKNMENLGSFQKFFRRISWTLRGK